MITIPLLSEKDLEIFNGKKVVIYGIRSNPMKVARVLQHFGVNIIAICIENIDEFLLKDIKVKHIPIIKKEDLRLLAHENSEILIQYVSFDTSEIEYMSHICAEMNIPVSPFMSGELTTSFVYLTYLANFKKMYIRRYIPTSIRNIYRKLRSIRGNLCDNRIWKYDNDTLLICSPPKLLTIPLCLLLMLPNTFPVNIQVKSLCI